MAVSHISMCN